MCVLSVSLYAFQPINGYRKLCFFLKKKSAIAVHQLFSFSKGGYGLRIDHSPKETTWMGIYRDESVVEATLFFYSKQPFCSRGHKWFHSDRSKLLMSKNTGQ